MKRTAPVLTARAGEYWRSGADGKLRITHCQKCGRYTHPPQPICPNCHSTDVKLDPVSGKATVFSFTINYYQWRPDMPPPYVIAEVELVEQAGLKILTNIVDIEPERIRIGMPVSVKFEQAGEVFIPVFAP
jgi:uncharacterized OB-fold protein